MAYTINRTKEDIKKIEQVRKILKNSDIQYSCNSYKADSKIYRDLPGLYIDAVKKLHDQDLAIDELTAKLHELQLLKDSFCRIIEMCKE